MTHITYTALLPPYKLGGCGSPVYSDLGLR